MLMMGKVNLILTLYACIGHARAFVCCCRPEVTLGVQEITEKKSKLGVSAGVIS